MPELTELPSNDAWRKKLFSPMVLLLLVFTPLLSYACYCTLLLAQTSVLDWADESDPTTRVFRQFCSQFEVPEVLVLGWPSKKWDDPSFAEIANRLRESDQADYFDQVKETATWVAELEQSSDRISTRSALRRLEGIVVGQEGQPSVIASLSESGQQNRPAVYRAVVEAAKQIGMPRDSIHIGGMVTEQSWIETEGILAPLRASPAAAIVCLVVCCIAVRSFLLGSMITWVSLLGALSSVSLFLVTGVPINAITSTLPTLGVLLTASLCLHWYGYYQREFGEPIVVAVRNANRQSRLPAGLAIMTTSCGMLSLAMSQTSVIRIFGYFGAGTTILAAFWALAVFPWVIRSMEIQPKPEQSLTARLWEKLFEQLKLRRVPVLILSFTAIAVALAGLFKIDTSVRMDSFFRANHPAIRDTKWLEANIGPLSQMDLVLTCHWLHESKDDNEEALRLLDELTLVRDVEQAVRSERADATTFSAYHVVPRIPKARGIRELFARRAYAIQLADNASRLEEFGVLHRDRPTGNGNHWRISFLTSTLGANELYSQQELAAKLRSTALASLADREGLQTSVQITGIPLLTEIIEQQFLLDLTLSYVSAVLFIFLAIWIGLRSFRLAVLAMFPNTFPPLIVLGMLGWMHVSLDVGSIMTASIALGIAVDDTVHLLVGVKRALKAGHSSLESVRIALQHSGNAVVRTSVLGAATLFVLSFSSFTPTARFGALIAGMLIAALIGDLILLPTLMMTKRGQKLTQQSVRKSVHRAPSKVGSLRG